MVLYRRRLPHIYGASLPVFLTWRLNGSLPGNRVFPDPKLSSGRTFAVLDRLLDQARTGPFYLRQPAVAQMIVEAIHYSADTMKHYVEHARSRSFTLDAVRSFADTDEVS